MSVEIKWHFAIISSFPQDVSLIWQTSLPAPAHKLPYPFRHAEGWFLALLQGTGEIMFSRFTSLLFQLFPALFHFLWTERAYFPARRMMTGWSLLKGIWNLHKYHILWFEDVILYLHLIISSPYEWRICSERIFIQIISQTCMHFELNKTNIFQM